MSRILAVEPSKVLRHALAIALSTEHQIQFMDSFPEPLALTDVEAVIVDAAMLRDHNALAAREVRAARGWTVPTVWIDGTAAFPTSVRESLVQLKPPVRKDELQKALVDCLRRAAGSKQYPYAIEGKPETVARARPKRAKEPVVSADEGVIELIDVVEDEQEQYRS